MATNTYVALATQTLASPAASVTFSSIPSGYTDLILIINGSTSVNEYVYFQVGNTTIDTGTNYSTTWLDSRVASARASNATAAFIGPATIANEQFNTTIHLQNYLNTSTNKTILSRGNSTGGWVTVNANLWRSTSVINTVKFILGGSGNYNAGTTFSIYGVAAASIGAKATGGTIYSDSSYYYHVFAANGTFTPTQNVTCDYLIVAGGGGGGSYGGGGGAGGLVTGTFAATTSTNYTASIGSGGAGGGTAGGSTGLPGTVGSNSIFNSITATGGGFGGGFGNAGGNGGSGGGGGLSDSNVTVAAGSASPTGQGSNGGTGVGSTTLNRSGGGGGGAAAVGTNGSGATGGAGGVGSSAFNSWLTASGMGQLVSGTYYIAGGGGGGADSRGTSASAGVGGFGGGANGSIATTAPSAGLANTGGGGGGGTYNGGFVSGSAGGSGLIIVRYAK